NQLSQDPNSYQIVLGKLLSQNRFELDLCEGEEAYSLEDLQDAFTQGAGISRIGGLKVLRLENDSVLRLFINGDVHELLNTPLDVIAQLSNCVSLTADEATEICQHEEVQSLLLKLINQGFYYLSDSEE
ncbi:MAG: winged helix domain-containing protein, partial [Shewanella sp.]